MTTKKILISKLKKDKILRTKEIISAFEIIDRKNFVLLKDKNKAYWDIALSIGFGQTISQPTTIAFMLELLGPQLGDRILDIGTGSGWSTALLADIVGSEGEVHGTEIISELVKFGQNNLLKYQFENAYIHKAKNILGLAKYAPYDKILVSATANSVPKTLINQLKNGGILVMPIKESIYKITKINRNRYTTEDFFGFMFVPLIVKKSFG